MKYQNIPLHIAYGRQLFVSGSCTVIRARSVADAFPEDPCPWLCSLQQIWGGYHLRQPEQPGEFVVAQMDDQAVC